MVNVAFLWPSLSTHERTHMTEWLDPGVNVAFASGEKDGNGVPLPDEEKLTATPEMLDAVSDADVIVGSRFSLDLLSAAPPDAMVIIPFAGILDADLDLLDEFPRMTICNCHYNASFVAEHAFALLLAVAKQIIPYDTALRRADWDPKSSRPSVTLRNKELVILGYGAIGKHLARIGHGFKMSVSAIRRRPSPASPPSPLAFLGTADDLEPLLRKGDAVMISLPLTEETRGMIGSRELGYLKETALLVNVSRGPIIDEKSLFEALVSRRIAGAGIDTWYQYPDSPEARADTKPAGLPFEELDQVVLSPHRAADVVERDLIRVEELAVQLNQINAGNPPENVIRPATG